VEADASGFQDLGLQLLEIQVSPEDERSPWHAANLPALRRRLGASIEAITLLLLTRIDDYPTSAPFVPLTDGDDKPAHIFFEGVFRDDLERVLRTSLSVSAANRLYFLSESAYSFVDDFEHNGPPGDPLERYTSFLVAPPMTPAAFLVAHDRDELREKIIYVIEGG
jgi:hypothetical protein